MIGALSLAIPYLGLPFVNALATRYRRYICHMLWAGWFFCLASLIAASFATEVWHLVMSQGLLFGMAQTFWFSPSVLLIDDWFDERRGLAYGILFGASGISGLALPFALEFGCRRLGFRWALRGFVCVALTISGPALSLIRQRRPNILVEARQLARARTHTGTAADRDRSRPASRFKFARNPWVYPFAIGALLQGLAYFLPPTFLPSYSTTLGEPHVMDDLLLALNSLAQFTGQVLLGYCSDKVHPMLLPAMTALCSGLAALLLWGFAKSYVLLAVFSLVWGFFSGSYSVLWSRACQHVTEDADESTLLYGILSFERGISLLLTGPISELMLEKTFAVGHYGMGADSWMAVFAGTAALLSSATGLAYLFEKREQAALARASV